MTVLAVGVLLSVVVGQAEYCVGGGQPVCVTFKATLDRSTLEAYSPFTSTLHASGGVVIKPGPDLNLTQKFSTSSACAGTTANLTPTATPATLVTDWLPTHSVPAAYLCLSVNGGTYTQIAGPFKVISPPIAIEATGSTMAGTPVPIRIVSKTLADLNKNLVLKASIRRGCDGDGLGTLPSPVSEGLETVIHPERDGVLFFCLSRDGGVTYLPEDRSEAGVRIHSEVSVNIEAGVMRTGSGSVVTVSIDNKGSIAEDTQTSIKTTDISANGIVLKQKSNCQISSSSAATCSHTIPPHSGVKIEVEVTPTRGLTDPTTFEILTETTVAGAGVILDSNLTRKIETVGGYIKLEGEFDATSCEYMGLTRCSPHCRYEDPALGKGWCVAEYNTLLVTGRVVSGKGATVRVETEVIAETGVALDYIPPPDGVGVVGAVCEVVEAGVVDCSMLEDFVVLGLLFTVPFTSSSSGVIFTSAMFRGDAQDSVYTVTTPFTLSASSSGNGTYLTPSPSPSSTPWWIYVLTAVCLLLCLLLVCLLIYCVTVPPRLTLTFVYSEGHTILSIPPDATLADLKTKLSKHLSVPPETIVLYPTHTTPITAPDNTLVRDCRGVVNGSVVGVESKETTVNPLAAVF